jgi:hypothetical protein
VPGALPTFQSFERPDLGHRVSWPRAWLVMALARLGWSGFDGTPALHGGPKRGIRASETILWVNGAGAASSAQPHVVFPANEEYRKGDRTRRCTSRRAGVEDAPRRP